MVFQKTIIGLTNNLYRSTFTRGSNFTYQNGVAQNR